MCLERALERLRRSPRIAAPPRPIRQRRREGLPRWVLYHPRQRSPPASLLEALAAARLREQERRERDGARAERVDREVATPDVVEQREDGFRWRAPHGGSLSGGRLGGRCPRL